MRWLDRLAHFDFSIKHTAGKNLALTDYLSKHRTEEAPTEKIHDEEYKIKTVSELFIIKHKYCQILSMDQKLPSTDQSANMTLKTKQESTN